MYVGNNGKDIAPGRIRDPGWEGHCFMLCIGFTVLAFLCNVLCYTDPTKW
jgi:hypothetical protein